MLETRACPSDPESNVEAALAGDSDKPFVLIFYKLDSYIGYPTMPSAHHNEKCALV